MRVAIGQVIHETSTFCARPTSLEDFKAWEWIRGNDIVRQHRGVRDYLGGMQSLDGRGARVSYGRMARLVIKDVDALVSSVRAQVLDPEVFLLHGIDVQRYKVVALKSSQHFRAGFESIAAHILTADPPGLTTTDLSVLPYTRIRRPMWPLDPDAEFAGAARS
jgi:microcystin degradation protein MlrC